MWRNLDQLYPPTSSETPLVEELAAFYQNAVVLLNSLGVRIESVHHHVEQSFPPIYIKFQRENVDPLYNQLCKLAEEQRFSPKIKTVGDIVEVIILEVDTILG